MAEFVNKFVKGKKGAQASGVLLLGLSIFLLISLVSYSAHDYPNSSKPPGEGVNWGGRIGAYLSYGTFMGIGYAAYVLPLLALLWGWNRLRYQPATPAAYRSVGLLCMALLFSIGSGLPTYSAYTAFKMGGWLGTQTSSVLLIPYVGRIGSAIFLGALFIAALILSTDIDLRPLLKPIIWGGRGSRRAADWFARFPERFREYMERRREARDEEPEEDEEDVAEPLPEIDRLPSIGRSGGETPEIESLEDLTPSEEESPVAEAEPVAEREKSGGKNGRVNRASGKEKQAAAVPPVAAPRAGKKKVGGRYKMPAIGLLDEIPDEQGKLDEESLLANARLLEEALSNFDVAGKVVEVSPGPVVTRYEVEPAPGVKVNRIVTLSDDLARVMSATGIRIQAPVPGKSVVGVEIANKQRETVYLREILESKSFRRADSKLTMVLGKTISGDPFATDLTKMPHLLVAGATGAGKSVCINCLICSILFKSKPDEVRFLMVDPKVVELTMYNDIPHLLVPVVTDPKKASEALKWAVAEMEVRYKKLAKLGVRNLADYNSKLERLNQEEREEGLEPEAPIPYIVIVIDEFADLMLTAPADVETSLMGLAQKSRAVGIHIILATQRPSVNVITGVIKANFPSRIAFQVASKTDSRTILDLNGAERLLGRGDMLFLPGGQGEPIRVHGAFVSGEETERLVEAIKNTEYAAEEVAIFADPADIKSGREEQDELFDEAVRLVVEAQQASTSFLQRRMKVGYSRAARLMDELETAGIVGPAEGAKPRQILIDGEELDETEDEELAAG